MSAVRPIGLAVCSACGEPTRAGDYGLCRSCDADFFDAPARPEPRPKCLRCGDIGYVERAGVSSRCQCLPDLALWKGSRIPERYLDAPVSTRPLAYVAESRLFFGPCDRGKTRGAVSLLKRWAKERPGGLFVDVFEWQEARKARVALRDGEEPLDDLPSDEAIRDAPFLVLDDIARRPRQGDYDEEGLGVVIKVRYNRSLPTIFTCNETPETLGVRIGEYLASRILEMCPASRRHDFSSRARHRT